MIRPCNYSILSSSSRTFAFSPGHFFLTKRITNTRFQHISPDNKSSSSAYKRIRIQNDTIDPIKEVFKTGQEKSPESTSMGPGPFARYILIILSIGIVSFGMGYYFTSFGLFSPSSEKATARPADHDPNSLLKRKVQK